MEKQCPVCGNRFPPFANVCDQHGVALVPARRSRLPVHAALIAAAAVAALTPFALRQFWLSRLDLQVQSAEIRNEGPTAAEAKDLNRWLAGKVLAITFRVSNSSALPVSVDSADYKLTVSSVTVHAGKAGASSPLDPGKDRQHEWRIPLADAATRQLLLHPPAGGVQAQIEARLHLRLGGLRWTAPYRQKYVIRPVLAL
jgi:hypothetical protein